ncbi:MAG: sulfurtransferase TusA family protein [Acidilobus sp.]
MTTRRVDLTGLDCPEPAILAFREFGKLEAGDWLEAVMDVEECAYTAAEIINRSRLGVATVQQAGEKKFVIRAVRLR